MMSKIVNLAHIKQPLPDVAAPLEKKRIAWDGGKISTNKDQAVLSFLKKKKERGGLEPETHRLEQVATTSKLLSSMY